MQSDSPTPARPTLIDLYEVRCRLRLDRDELQILIEIGIITPVGRTREARPLFDAAAIDRLTSRQQRARLRDACGWDFEPHPDRKGRGGRPWAPPVDLPFYPFDDEEQHQWARKLHEWRKRYSPFPLPKHYVATRMRRAEAIATRAFDRAHQVKRKPKGLNIRVRKAMIRLTRGQLLKLVWSKTMIRAGADLCISEFALRQLCKKLQVPTPARGHFNHKDLKQRTPRPALPPVPSRNLAIFRSKGVRS